MLKTIDNRINQWKEGTIPSGEERQSLEESIRKVNAAISEVYRRLGC